MMLYGNLVSDVQMEHMGGWRAKGCTKREDQFFHLSQPLGWFKHQPIQKPILAVKCSLPLIKLLLSQIFYNNNFELGKSVNLILICYLIIREDLHVFLPFDPPSNSMMKKSCRTHPTTHTAFLFGWPSHHIVDVPWQHPSLPSSYMEGVCPLLGSAAKQSNTYVLQFNLFPGDKRVDYIWTHGHFLPQNINCFNGLMKKK